MLDKLCSGMGCSPTDNEFNGNESTRDVKQSFFKQKQTYHKVMY